jgi:ArsR family transcriptional regulator
MRDRLNSDACCKYLKALAEPERLRIIQCLQKGPQQVGEISRSLNSPIANVSHHLKQLRTAGLIAGIRKGRFVTYALATDILDKGKPGSLDVLDFGCCRVQLGSK